MVHELWTKTLCNEIVVSYGYGKRYTSESRVMKLNTKKIHIYVTYIFSTRPTLFARFIRNCNDCNNDCECHQSARENWESSPTPSFEPRAHIPFIPSTHSLSVCVQVRAGRARYYSSNKMLRWVRDHSRGAGAGNYLCSSSFDDSNGMPLTIHEIETDNSCAHCAHCELSARTRSKRNYKASHECKHANKNEGQRVREKKRKHIPANDGIAPYDHLLCVRVVCSRAFLSLANEKTIPLLRQRQRSRRKNAHPDFFAFFGFILN